MVRQKRATIGAFLAITVAFALLHAPRDAANAQVPPESVLQLTAGDDHVCALLASGEIHCWGRNDYGQAGDGTYIDRITPSAVKGIPPSAGAIRQIDANGYSSCALTGAGAVYCWGNNSHGQLGLPTTTTSTTVARIVPTLPASITQISVGDQHVCALDSNNKVWCWGRNNVGQLGRGIAGSSQSTPATATSFEERLGNQVKRVAAGGEHTCVLTSAALVWCVGNSGLGGFSSTTEVSQVMRPSTAGEPSTPLSGATDLVSKVGHTCAYASNSMVGSGPWLQCWGKNDVGQAGVDTGQQAALPYAYDVTPPAAAANQAIGAAAMSIAHTCAIINAAPHCWGSNAYGKLGTNSNHATFTHIPSPVVVIPTANRRTLDFALGYNFTCARTEAISMVTSAATVYCWGQNDYGQIGRPKSVVETSANAIVFTTQQSPTATPRPPTATPAPRPTVRRYLPMAFAELGTETEDNDTGASANELPVNKLLTGRFDDTFDVFVTQSTTGTLIVSVSGVSAAYVNQVQLQIYRGPPGANNRVDEATAAPFVVTARGADTYYIVTYSARPQASQTYQILASVR